MEEFSVDDILAEVAADASDDEQDVEGKRTAAGAAGGRDSPARHGSMDSADDAALLEALLMEDGDSDL
jgi:hypothetical protein